MASYVQALIDSILPQSSKPQPILPNQKVLNLMNLSFCLLLVTQLGLFIITSFNLHVLCLMVVSCCLWISIGWFVGELGRMDQVNRPLDLSNRKLVPNSIDDQVAPKPTKQE
ncbi:hypothetical protein BY996DRAFT_4597736 [Phakopsora pachyrhizi]|uniref:Uncharacterized protein n=1 Tax=Phakopsora pachyrhizi TaxID=170000 RepID=A0AAV0BTJ8_PHAPC|nr:hypothetical protein BY996DRAFT_4597736 [Phakopsora pachyrhizi]CAH7690026.1 hypothetical protein PPACK8108_LOCUS25249 [Phakopsora pachyrhizi]